MVKHKKALNRGPLQDDLIKFLSGLAFGYGLKVDATEDLKKCFTEIPESEKYRLAEHRPHPISAASTELRGESKRTPTPHRATGGEVRCECEEKPRTPWR